MTWKAMGNLPIGAGYSTRMKVVCYIDLKPSNRGFCGDEDDVSPLVLESPGI